MKCGIIDLENVSALEKSIIFMVAMGGITAPAKKEFESLRSIIQVWDAEALLDQLFATYPLLPDSTKAALPLKQVWVLDDDTEA